MSFNDFVQNYKLHNEATSNIKTYQVLCTNRLDNVGIYLRDRPFSSDVGIVNLHPFEGTHWVSFFHECYFDSYGCLPPQKLSKFIIERTFHF